MTDRTEDAEFVGHSPCPACGSSDANSDYSDGHSYCFACRHYSPPDGEGRPTRERKKMDNQFVIGEVRALPRRGITEATCAKFGYRVGTHHGKNVQIAEYRDADGEVVAQKLRDSNKEFSIVGDGKNMGLFGMHLWQAGGKRIVVTEGEIDAMSAAQMFGLSWPVVSLPNGASNAKKAIQRNLEYLESFEQVVLAFDMDEPGRAAVKECAPLFSPGKCAVASLPKKDANEMLVANEVKAFSSAIWQAAIYRPGGIVNGADLWDRIQGRQAPGLPYPWKGLTKMTYGQHLGKLVTWTSGTGMGKSTAVAQVAYGLAFPTDKAQRPLRVGYVALEEDVGRAAQRFLSHRLGKLCHLPGAVDEADMKRAFEETLASGQVWFHDHFGSTDSDDLLGKLRYLAKGVGCEAIVVDHLSIIVSGMSLGDDERRTIDRTMTMLRTLVEETGVMMHLVSHLRRTGDDKGAEEGARISLSHLRGSQAIAQLSDYVIAFERNQQAEGEKAREAIVRVLKNRVSGDTGVACKVRYDKETGMLEEVEESDDVFGDEGVARDF